MNIRLEHNVTLNKKNTKNELLHDGGYDAVRFWGTLMILLHHYYTTCIEKNIPIYPIVKQLVLRAKMGGAGVGLFFMLSGALLYKSSKETFSLQTFYKKRALRILIPYWIASVVAIPIMYITWPGIISAIINNRVSGNIIAFLGLNYSGEKFWSLFGIKPGVSLVGEWFTAVIVFLYISFPLLHWMCKHYRFYSTVLIFFVFVLNLKYEIFTYANGFFSITNGLMYFWMGMLFEEYKGIVKGSQGYCGIMALAGCATLFYLNPTALLGITYLPSFVMSITFFLFFYFTGIGTRFTLYICEYSYEIYLIHHRIYLILMPLVLNIQSSYLQSGICFLVLIGLVFVLAEKLKTASKYVVNFAK